MSLVSVAPKPHTTAWFWSSGCSLGCHLVMPVKVMRKRKKKSYRVVRAETNGGGGEAVENGKRDSGGGYRVSAMEVTTFNQSFNDAADFPVWEKIGAIVRLGYGIGESSTFHCFLSPYFDFIYSVYIFDRLRNDFEFFIVFFLKLL